MAARTITTITTGDPVTTAPRRHLVSLALSGAALFGCSLVYELVMSSTLGLYLLWLNFFGPILVPSAAFGLIAKRSPLPFGYSLWALPGVLYLSGLSSGLFSWVLKGDADFIPKVFFDWNTTTAIYGPYGITAALLWAACLLRSWRTRKHH